MNKTASLICITLLSACTESAAPKAAEPSGYGEKTTREPAKPAPPKGALSLGDAAPLSSVAMPGVDGAEHSIEGVKGEKGTLVIFTCNHCPYVKAWESRTVAAANMALDKGIGVIAINANDPEAHAEDGMEGMKARAEKTRMKYPYVVDQGEVAKAHGAAKTPELYLYDADLELVYHGAVDDNSRSADAVEKTYLVDAIHALAAGEPIPNPETKALGCSIKYRPDA